MFRMKKLCAVVLSILLLPLNVLAEVNQTKALSTISAEQFSILLQGVAGEQIDLHALIDDDSLTLEVALTKDQEELLLSQIAMQTGRQLKELETQSFVCIPLDTLETQARYDNPGYTWNYNTCEWEYDYTQDPKYNDPNWTYVEDETGSYWLYTSHQSEDNTDGKTKALEIVGMVGIATTGIGAIIILSGGTATVFIVGAAILTGEGVYILSGDEEGPVDGDGTGDNDDSDDEGTPDNDPGNEPGSDGGDWV